MKHKKRERAGFTHFCLFFKRLALLALVFSFILQPLSVVWAQEVSGSSFNSIIPDSVEKGEVQGASVEAGDPSLSNAQTEAQEPDNVIGYTENTDEPAKDLNADELKKPEDEPMLQATAMATGTQGEGLKFKIPTQAQATVDQSTGALVYEYPISLPDGRAGMTPELSIKYNSRNSSKPDSYIGLGWETSIPYIAREPVKGTNNIYAKAFFSSSLSGNLIATTDTTNSQFAIYRPEADGGEYLKYTYNSNNTWTMTGKDGRTYTFGASTASRQDDPNDSTKVYKWMLSKISDVYGDEIQYTYIKDNGQIYPSQILYTYHSSAPAVNTVSFTYTTPVNYGSTIYNAVFPITTYKLLSSILVDTTVGTDTTTDRYDFNYNDAQFLKQKNLVSIQKTYSFPQSSFNQSFSGYTYFSYSVKTPGWQAGTHSLAGKIDKIDDGLLSNIFTADFDRNGYPDVLKIYSLNNTLHNGLYLNNGSTFVDSWNSWGLPSQILTQHYSIVDVNGDNFPDLHPHGYSTSESHALYLNTGSGFSADSSGTWEVGTYVPEVYGCSINNGEGTSSQHEIYLHDINNDGKNDIVYFGSSTDFRVFLNNGNGFSQSNAYTFNAGGTSFINNGCNGSSSTSKFQTLIDVNGDGLLDYYNKQYGTYLNTGSGFGYDSAYTINIAEMDRSGFSDLNGDGLLDYVALSWYNGSNACINSYLNTGIGFSKVFPNSSPCGSSGIWDPGVLNYSNGHPEYWNTLIDVTADGYPDVMGWDSNSRWSTGDVKAINDGKDSWVYNPDPNIGGQDYWTQAVDTVHGIFFDVNADGVLDFITPEGQWGGGMIDTTKVGIGSPAVPNRLTTITSMLGAKTDIGYGTSPTNYSDTDAVPMSVVKKISTSNIGLGQPDMITQYDYQGGVYVVDQATGQKRFAGFHKVTASESGANLAPLRISDTYFHQSNGSDSSTSEPADNSLALIGRPYYSVVKDPSSVLKKETWNKYGQYTLASEPIVGRVSRFVYPLEVVTKTTEVGSVTGTADVYAFNTTLGEQTEIRNMGFVNIGVGGSYVDISGDTRYKFTDYASNTNGTLVKPKRVDVRTSPTTTTFRTDYFYDNQPLGVIGTLGNLTKETSWISGNGTTLASTIYTYDIFGNLLTKTNPRGAVTTYSYDATKSLVASETNHLNQTTTYEYINGKLTKVTDPNGRVVIYRYSTKGWLYSTQPQNTGGTPLNEQYLEYNGINWFVHTSSQLVDKIPGNHQELSVQVLDNLGRVVRVISQRLNHDTDFISGMYLKEIKNYDALGREVSRSAPSNVFTTAGYNYASLVNAAVPANLFTNTSYDVFDRPVSVTNSLGATVISYKGPETTTIDANTKQKKAKTDAYGNLVEVKEDNGASVYTTTYQYNEKNLLTKVTDALGNIRNFTYNNIGWLTNSQDIRGSSDTTYGASSFTYDLNGNQLVETQPNAITVTRVYDMLDRLTSINGSNTTPVDYVLTYDTCTNGKGRVCTVTGTLPNSTTLSKSYVYGISGVPTSAVITTLGNTYTTSYQYNLSDQVSKITYPNGAVVRIAFGDWALPYKTYITLPGGVENLYATIDYHYSGQPEIITITNGPTVTNVYDANKLYRKTSKTVVQGGNTLSSFAYTYDNTNNITQVIEPGVTKTYTYDDLYRLTQAVYTPTSGTAKTYNYAYNAIGNITNANGLAYTYSSAGKINPHAVTKIGTSTYNYDANGNMTSAPNLVITNNWQNQPTRVVVGGATTIDTYYDENGERFIFKSPSKTEVQVEEEYIVRNNVPEISIKLAGNLLGTIVNNVLYSSITDHLGTPIKQVDSAGTVVEDVTYDPFGKWTIQTSTINTKRGYTGHEEDSNTGLVYAEARYYNPGAMRFSQQDPSHVYLGHQAFSGMIGVERNAILLDPQQLNSYSYVRNNPINLTDPTGLLVATMSGTWHASGEKNSLKKSKTLQANIEKSFPGQKVFNFEWSGGDNIRARRRAAEKFSKEIKDELSKLPANEPLNIVCHSHGCNVAALYSTQKDSVTINNLVTFGGPVRGNYKFNENSINNHINVYSEKDWVQISGGGQIAASGLLGGVVGSALCGIGCGVLGFMFGSVANMGEFGLAGRKINGADYNKNATQFTNSGVIDNHSQLFGDNDIWNSLISPYVNN